MATKTATQLGVPEAEFIEDVDAYMAGKEAEATLKMLQERYQQYKLAESRVQQMRVRLQAKMPDIKKGLEMVTLLCTKRGSGEEVNVDFELADNMYAKAKIKDAETVNIWLGANVMLEYTVEEAKELLSKNLENCIQSLESTKQDMYFLRDQITITEVSIARVYNFDVKRRREAGAKEKDEMES
mmetsp:Transcript_36217/g.79044  ORF Transcript_36217/g.79044 Transcript_36217/m.79044 type:complete len:184 (-) Transcript_36217:362-913(-)|eukprot:CAMPEP_0118921574 /NCGR_PEP_ID=MMETSP1169-20130426/804_1 /TAXON_ID=36882 /ORGANISM="Pyramimonas obovata, Strain CCMP722" /LENGTH=183 /DNA_ID=CAMNT_0006862321 /DNA_START=119 /DNA_END=670 /DNA_ORIENTATION=+